jgi:hypothetical protein
MDKKKLTKAADDFMSGKMDMSKMNQGMFKGSTIKIPIKKTPVSIDNLEISKQIADEMNRAGVRNSYGKRSSKYYKD